MKISDFNMNSGRMIREDGTVVNIADILTSDANAVSDIKERTSSYQIHSGRFIREDGTIVNLADLIADGQIGGGGGGTTNYNNLTNKPQINGVELSGNKTSDDLGISAETTQVDHGTSDTTFTLSANQYHTWGEVAALTLTLAAEESGVVNEYHFAFDSGDTATTLSLPDGIQTDIVVEPSTHYECSIIDNYMTFRDWPVESAGGTA